MVKIVKRAAGLTALVAAVLLAGQGVSQAAPGVDAKPGNPAPGMRIVMQDGPGTVSVPANTGDTKEQWLAKYGTEDDVSTMAAGHLVSTAYASGPAGSQSFKANGYTDVSTGCGTWDCTATYRNNYAEISWLGSSPYNANTVNGSIKWWVGGVDVSPSLPSGVGFSKNGSAITWQPGAVNNTWRVTLNYSAGVEIDASYINTAYFTDQGDILLGSSWYHVQGNQASLSVW